MSVEPGLNVADDDSWAPLVDSSNMSIGELFASDDSKLAACVRRLVDSLDDPNGVISAFNNFAS